MGTFKANYKKMTKARRRCSLCNTLISDGEEVVGYEGTLGGNIGGAYTVSTRYQRWYFDHVWCHDLQAEADDASRQREAARQERMEAISSDSSLTPDQQMAELIRTALNG